MFDLKEQLTRSQKLRLLPGTSALCAGDKRVTNILTYGEHEQTAQIWVENTLGSQDVFLLLGALFGQYTSDYTFRSVVSDFTGKEETEITLNRIPTIITVGLMSS